MYLLIHCNCYKMAWYLWKVENILRYTKNRSDLRSWKNLLPDLSFSFSVSLKTNSFQTNSPLNLLSLISGFQEVMLGISAVVHRSSFRHEKENRPAFPFALIQEINAKSKEHVWSVRWVSCIAYGAHHLLSNSLKLKKLLCKQTFDFTFLVKISHGEATAL